MNSFGIIKRFQVFKYQAVCMFVIADLKAVQPFPFYQRMKGFDTGIILRKSFLEIASIHFCCCLFIFFRYILAASVTVDDQR